MKQMDLEKLELDYKVLEEEDWDILSQYEWLDRVFPKLIKELKECREERKELDRKWQSTSNWWKEKKP